MAGDKKPERRKLCLFLFILLKVHPLNTHLLADGLRPSRVSGPVPSRRGSQKDSERSRALGFAWLCLDPAGQQQPRGLPRAAAEQNPPRVSSLSRAGFSLSVEAVFAWGKERRVHPRNVLCKDERSRSGIKKQLLPYYTWPCTQRVHHHVVGTLTRRVAQKSCRV